MPPTAVADPPSDSKPATLTEEQAALRHEGVEAGFMPTFAELEDINSYFRTSVPGGAQPGDSGFYTVPGEESTPPLAAVPPTPPAAAPDDDEVEETSPLLHLLGNKELGLKVGGRKPDSAVLKIKGGKIALDGQFDLEDRFPAVFDLQITGDGTKHGIETATGTVKSSRKDQEATICGTATVADWLALRLEHNQELLSVVLKELDLTAEAAAEAV